tara:strand:+ start:276 stop:578 length:303 start_codon:yes stop_codon:yes gene_type:complete
MPYSDGFATTRAASFFGTDADDRRADRAAEIVAADLAAATKLQIAASTFFAAIKDIEFITRNPAGWDIDEVQGMAADCAAIDINKYWRDLERDAPDFARI